MAAPTFLCPKEVAGADLGDPTPVVRYVIHRLILGYN